MSVPYRLYGLSVAALLAACASPPERIGATYVSPLEYQGHDCQQLSGELVRVTTRANELAGNLQKTSSNDNVKMGVGLILFWPTLFFLSGNGAEASEFAQLKGRRDAIEQEAIQKKCTLPAVQPISPPVVQAAPTQKNPLQH